MHTFPAYRTQNLTAVTLPTLYRASSISLRLHSLEKDMSDEFGKEMELVRSVQGYSVA